MFNSFYSILAIATISLGMLACKKENNQPPPIPLSSGRVVEYGSRVSLAGVMFSIAIAKNMEHLAARNGPLLQQQQVIPMVILPYLLRP